MNGVISSNRCRDGRHVRPHLMRAILRVAVVATFILVAGHSSAQPLPTAAPTLPPHYLEERLAQLTNDERARAAVPALRTSRTLTQAARHHAIVVQGGTIRLMAGR